MTVLMQSALRLDNAFPIAEHEEYRLIAANSCVMDYEDYFNDFTSTMVPCSQTISLSQLVIDPCNKVDSILLFLPGNICNDTFVPDMTSFILLSPLTPDVVLDDGLVLAEKDSTFGDKSNYNYDHESNMSRFVSIEVMNNLKFKISCLKIFDEISPFS